MERKLKNLLGTDGFNDVSRERSKQMGRIGGRGNKSTEWRLRLALVRAGISGWRLHPAELPGNPDFYFPRSRLVIFVDGCFWHRCPRCGHLPKTRRGFWRAKLLTTVKRDREITRTLCAAGLTVLRVWEHELRAEREQVLARLTSLVARIEDTSPELCKH